MNVLIPVTTAAAVSYPLPNRDYKSDPGPVSPILIGVSPGGSGSITVTYRIAKGGVVRSFATGNLVGAQTSAVADTMLVAPYELIFTASGANGAVELAW